MATSDQINRHWFNGWSWPFLWILLIPVVTVPGQAILLQSVVQSEALHADQSNCVVLRRDYEYGMYHDFGCPVGDVLPTLLPGLLNLAPLFWLLSARHQVRMAALVAGILGAIRLGVPAVLYIISHPQVSISSTFPLPWMFGGGDAALLSVVLWFASLGAVMAFSLLKQVGPSTFPRSESLRKRQVTGRYYGLRWRPLLLGVTLLLMGILAQEGWVPISIAGLQVSSILVGAGYLVITFVLISWLTMKRIPRALLGVMLALIGIVVGVHGALGFSFSLILEPLSIILVGAGVLILVFSMLSRLIRKRDPRPPVQ